MRLAVLPVVTAGNDFSSHSVGSVGKQLCQSCIKRKKKIIPKVVSNAEPHAFLRLFCLILRPSLTCPGEIRRPERFRDLPGIYSEEVAEPGCNSWLV